MHCHFYFLDGVSVTNWRKLGAITGLWCSTYCWKLLIVCPTYGKVLLSTVYSFAIYYGSYDQNAGKAPFGPCLFEYLQRSVTINPRISDSEICDLPPPLWFGSYNWLVRHPTIILTCVLVSPEPKHLPLMQLLLILLSMSLKQLKHCMSAATGTALKQLQ